MTSIADLRDEDPRPETVVDDDLVSIGRDATSAQATCEADWRFLLGDAGLGRVAVVGPCAPDLLASLRAVAPSVDFGATVAVDGTFDTVVVDAPTRGTVARAVALVGPGGALWLRGVGALGRRRLLGQLAASGLDDLSCYWHRPAIERTTLLVGLDERRSAAAVLRSFRSGRKGSFEAALAASGLIARVGSEVSVLARRTTAAAPQAVAAPTAGRPVAALITPRFAASQAVIGVSVDAGRGALDRVAKVPRVASGSDQVVHEADALTSFAAQDGPAGAPAHELLVRGDRQVLVEAVAEGRPLDRRLVRADRERALRVGLEWLTQVPVGSPSAPCADGRREHLLVPAGRALSAVDAPSAPWRARAVERTLDALEPLVSAQVPVVFEHGDFSHPNLFLGDDDRLAVIDWERAVIGGLPLNDAFFYCGYLAAATAGAESDDALVESYLALTGPHGWARAQIELLAERMQVDRRFLRLLELSTWFRASAALAGAGATPRSPEPHRHEVLWMALLDACSRSDR